MGKVVKVKNKTRSNSFLNRTVAKVGKTVQHQAKYEAEIQKKRALKLERSNVLPKRVYPKRAEVRKIKRDNYHQQLGVLHLSHIPHGFYEEQLRRFFSQFGKIVKVQLQRSTVSGRSKGHAFIVFRYKEVADIAAETTHNYLMGKRILKAKVIPPEEVKPKWFYHSTPSDIRHTVASVRRRKQINIINKKLTPKENKKRVRTQRNTVARMVKKLQEKGIDFKCKVVQA